MTHLGQENIFSQPTFNACFSDLDPAETDTLDRPNMQELVQTILGEDDDKHSSQQNSEEGELDKSDDSQIYETLTSRYNQVMQNIILDNDEDFLDQDQLNDKIFNRLRKTNE